MGLNSLHNLIYMKVYIDNYEVSELFKKIGEIDKLYKYTKDKIELFTDDGIFTIEDNSMYQLKVADCDKIEKDWDYKLIVDKSTYTKDLVYQLPPNHIVLSTTQFFYALSFKSNVKLVIEGIYNGGGANKYDGFTPTDFYFDVNDEISLDGRSVKDDFKIFL